MPILHTLTLCIVLLVAAKTGAWLLQLRTRNGGLVDAVWAWSIGALALLIAAVSSAPPDVRIALGLMGGIWGLRLGTHLWRRNWGKPEDWRYAKFRAAWGAHADRNMFWFFQFQNLFSLMLVASAFLPPAYRADLPPSWCFVLAAAVWLVAVAGEGIADAQMARFRADPASKGQVCRRGLWRYSRHPNYFFECLHWCAYLPLAWGSPWGWATLAAPLVMAFLLLKMSGVPLLEREMAQRKPGYAEYMRTTSPLIPWPPKE